MYTQEEITKADGPFTAPDSYSESYIRDCIAEIERFPSILKSFASSLTPEQEKACYREGGWNFKQVIHHLADSHMQAFSRFKLALTEDKPVIKPYIQNAWADTADSKTGSILDSVDLLIALHKRWVLLMRSMSIEDFSKIYIHPEYGKEFSLAYAAGLYAWHGHHHYTQIYRYASNQGWVK